ncbi:MAG: hypothetical protein Q7R87_02095 [Nanoarchaeota archaeon]|nr:hypothetical protein [Nanoarchaeota archaeon]
MVNQNKKNQPRFWKMWQEAGAVPRTRTAFRDGELTSKARYIIKKQGLHFCPGYDGSGSKIHSLSISDREGNQYGHVNFSERFSELSLVDGTETCHAPDSRRKLSELSPLIVLAVTEAIQQPHQGNTGSYAYSDKAYKLFEASKNLKKYKD